MFKLTSSTAATLATALVLPALLLAGCASGPSASSPADRSVSVLCEPQAPLNAYSQRALLGVGFEAMQGGRVACAERLFTEAARIDAKDPWAQLNLGVASHRLGKLEQARLAYQTAAALDPVTSGIKLSAQGQSAQTAEVAVAASASESVNKSPGQIALQNLKLIP